MTLCAAVAPVANSELTLISWLLVYSWLPLYYGVCFLPPLAISWLLSKPFSAGCSAVCSEFRLPRNVAQSRLAHPYLCWTQYQVRWSAHECWVRAGAMMTVSSAGAINFNHGGATCVNIVMTQINKPLSEWASDTPRLPQRGQCSCQASGMVCPHTALVSALGRLPGRDDSREALENNKS